MSTMLTVALDPPGSRHRFGVTSLAFSKRDHGNILYSASRDATVRGFPITHHSLSDATLHDNLTATTLLDEHHDWVNDLLVLG